MSIGGVCAQNTAGDGCSFSYEVNAGSTAGSSITGPSVNHSFSSTFSSGDVSTIRAGTGTFPVSLTGGSTYTITPMFAVLGGGTATFSSSTLVVQGY